MTLERGEDELVKRAVPQPSFMAPWPMAQHDPAHTGTGSYQAPPTPYLKWQYQSPWQLSVAVVDAQGIFVTSADGTVHALNPANGVENWRAALPGGFATEPSLPIPAPALSNDDLTIYVVSKNNVTAFDKMNGTMLWSTYLSGPGGMPNPSGVIWDPYIADDGTIVVAGPPCLWNVNPDGAVNWTIQASSEESPGVSVNIPPTIGPGNGSYNMFWATTNPQSLSAQNSAGGFFWGYPPMGEGAYYPLTLNPDDPSGASLYAATKTDLAAYSAADGGRKWTYQADVSGALAIDSKSNHIYIPTTNGSLVALNFDGSLACGSLVALNFDGSLAWTIQLSISALCTPTVDAGSLVLVGDVDGMVHTLNPNGALGWSFGASLSGMLWNSLVSIGPEQTVYASGLYSLTALTIKPHGKGTPIIFSSYNSNSVTVLLPWYISYLMSQGMSITQALESILSGNAPPPITPRGPVPEAQSAFVEAATTALYGAQLIFLALTAPSDSLRNQLSNLGIRMTKEAAAKFTELNEG